MDVEKAYQILDLKFGASFKELDEAYHDMLFLWDPDRLAENSRLRARANNRRKEIQEAYSVLAESFEKSTSQRVRPRTPGRSRVSEPAPIQRQRGGRASLLEDAFTERSRSRKYGPRTMIGIIALIVVLAGIYFLSQDSESPATSGDRVDSSSSIQTDQPVAGRDNVESEPEPSRPVPEILNKSQTPPLSERESRSRPDETRNRVPQSETQQREGGPELLRDEVFSDEDIGSPQSLKVLKEENSWAFNRLKEAVPVVGKISEGQYSKYEFKDWTVLRVTGLEVWIDLVTRQKDPQREVHLLWAVDKSSRKIRPLNEASRRLLKEDPQGFDDRDRI